MKLYNVVLTDSPCGNPFAPKKHGIVDAAATVIGSLLGGIFGSKSQDSANETNLEIARMNRDAQREANRQNYEMFQEQNRFNLGMWNKQNEYNDPKAQVQRLLNAGINPASGFGQTTPASSISSAQGTPMLAETLDYQKQPYDISGAFQGAVNAFTQSRLASAEIRKSEEMTHGISLDNEEKQRGMMDRLKYLSELAKHEGFVGELAKTQLDFERQAFNVRQAMLVADYTMQLKQINLAQEQFNQARLQNELYKIQVAYAPKLNEAQLKQYYATVNQLKAQIGLINANKLLTDAQREHEIEKKCGTIIDNGLKGLGFQLQNETKKYVIENAKNEAILSGKDVEDYEANWWNRVIQGYIPFASGSATAGTKAYLKVK